MNPIWNFSIFPIKTEKTSWKHGLRYNTFPAKGEIFSLLNTKVLKPLVYPFRFRINMCVLCACSSQRKSQVVSCCTVDPLVTRWHPATGLANGLNWKSFFSPLIQKRKREKKRKGKEKKRKEGGEEGREEEMGGS